MNKSIAQVQTVAQSKANPIVDASALIVMLRTVGLLAWGVLVFIQWIIYIDEESIAVVLLLLFGGIFGVLTMLKQSLLLEYPLSTFMALGYVSFWFLLPPLATFFEGKPVTSNLVVPEEALFHSVVVLLIIVFAHFVYRNLIFLKRLRWLISDKFYKPFSMFKQPSNFHLLVMGFVGAFALAYQLIVAKVVQADALGIVNKFMQGLYPLAYLPLIVFVSPLMGGKNKLTKRWLSIFGVYSVLIIFLSFARNSRNALFIGVASIGIAFIYEILIGLFPVNQKVVNRGAVLLILGFVLLKPATDISTSMVIVRGKRTDLSAIELIIETIRIYQDKDLLSSYREVDYYEQRRWDERYVDNLFFSRLANLKFIDNGIYLSRGLSDVSKELIKEIEFQRILSIFPRPIISFFNIPVDKDYVTSGSSGDFMFSVAAGYSYAIGGFRTGSLAGNAYAIFNWGYPFILLALFLLLFPVVDASTNQMIAPVSRGSGVSKWRPIITPIMIPSLFTWFFFLTSGPSGAEAINDLTDYLIRGWIQVVVIYIFAYWITFFPTKFVSRR